MSKKPSKKAAKKGTATGTSSARGKGSATKNGQSTPASSLSTPAKVVIIIFAVVSGELLDIPVELIGTFQKELFEYIDGTYGDIPETIRATGKLEDDIKSRLTQAIEEFKKKFLSEH